jgi:hypothetical protein
MLDRWTQPPEEMTEESPNSLAFLPVLRPPGGGASPIACTVVRHPGFQSKNIPLPFTPGETENGQEEQRLARAPHSSIIKR